MSHRAIQAITDFIFMEDEPKICDIILIPGASRAEITERAAELYKAGYAPYIMPSGKHSIRRGHFAYKNVDNPRYVGDYETEFEFMKLILLKNGVPESAILKEDQATHTMENAVYSAELLEDLGLDIKSAIISCQSFHARRVYLSYACYFPGVDLFMVPTDTQGITKDNWIETERGIKMVMSEVKKCGIYFEDMTDELQQLAKLDPHTQSGKPEPHKQSGQPEPHTQSRQPDSSKGGAHGLDHRE